MYIYTKNYCMPWKDINQGQSRKQKVFPNEWTKQNLIEGPVTKVWAHRFSNKRRYVLDKHCREGQKKETDTRTKGRDMKRACAKSCDCQKREQVNPQLLSNVWAGKIVPWPHSGTSSRFPAKPISNQRIKESIDMVHLGLSPHVAWRGIQKLSIEDVPQLFLLLGLFIYIIKKVRVPLI